MPVGSRLLVRSKADWRQASISKRSDEKIVITVCSPGGRTYRLRRTTDAGVILSGHIAVLIADFPDTWRSNFSCYDTRW
jgi:hypothetical protein